MFGNLKSIAVDDIKTNLQVLELMAKKINLPIETFTDPLEALEYLKRNQVDIVFIDYVMPSMNGIELTKNIRLIYPDVPIVMITSIKDDQKLKIAAIDAGVTEFLNKPLNAPEFTARVKNLLQLQILLKERVNTLEYHIKKATEAIIQREHETLDALGKAAEYKDPETGNHILRVGNYSKVLIKTLGASESNQELILYSSTLHDIGKIGINDNILLKPGKLTSEEYEIMKKHTLIGYDILKDKTSEYLRIGSIIAKTHHEKYDGSGYPEGLKGENIPIEGRIVALADVFDALTSKRPYKEPWSFEKAIQLILSEKGKHFDPKLVDYFISAIQEIYEIYKKYKD